MKTIVLLTGPQGSGNHLFAKVLALHPEVYGWKSLLETDWEGHDKEPLNQMWKDPAWIDTFDWEQSRYYVASISCPYFDNGVSTIPLYREVINKLASKNLSVKVVVIGRDENILKFQETRVRDKITYPIFLEQLLTLTNFNPIFVSQELLYLYRHNYLKSIQNILKIPVAFDDTRIDSILSTDANTKYFTPAKTYYRDELAQVASSKHE
jgi:hypothetical protein